MPRASSDYASLSLSTDLTQQPGGNDTSYCAVYNPSYVSLPTGNRPSPTHFHRAFYPEATDPYGCTALPSDTSVNQSLLLDRGNCTFYRKALLAQRANGTMLVVVYNETILDTVPSLDPENSSDSDLPAITIPVLFVSNDTGKKLKVREMSILAISVPFIGYLKKNYLICLKTMYFKALPPSLPPPPLLPTHTHTTVGYPYGTPSLLWTELLL